MAARYSNTKLASNADLRGTVLLVEDDHDVRLLVRAILEGEGYQVFTAANGRDAIDLLRQLTNAPQLVLTDLNMPIMDGWEFVKRLHGEAAFASLPVVIQTSADDPPPNGVVGIVRKPVDVAALMRIVRQHCG